jgi:hypothetical protein
MEKVIFKCYSKGDKNDDMLFVNASDIRKIRTVSNGNYTKLFVDYYDDDFCVNSTFFCDYVEPMEII